MPDSRVAHALDNFGRALARLEEALALPEGDPNSPGCRHSALRSGLRDGWKALQRCLAAEKIEARYPKEVFRQAYQAGWLAREAPWIRMVEDRNLVAHTYNEATAARIYADVRAYRPEFRGVLAYLTDRFGS